MTKEQIKRVLIMSLVAYREQCPEYADIQVIPVVDEDTYMDYPPIVRLFDEGYEFIDMNAFGDISGRVGSIVILGKKANASQT